MDVLESREAALRTRLLGAQVPSASQETLVERLQRLQAQLEQLAGSVAGADKLQELYQENASQLQLRSAGAFALGSARAGDEMKRAAVLSSSNRVQEAVTQLHRLQELQGVLERLQTPAAEQLERLQRLEEAGEQQTERALAVHARVERVLATYQQMMLVLSEKCVEYSALLDQLQV